MANPSAAHEPSMEEILASIRQIISEDGEPSQAPASQDAEAEEASATGEEAASASAAELEEATPEPEAIEAEAEIEAEPEPERAYAHGESMTPSSSGNIARAESYAPSTASTAEPAEPQASHQPTRREENRHLLSPQSDEAIHGAFSALAHTILAQNARTLEDLVAEMLQPMLKSWLDDNLPALVERLVQDEIQRVSRGRP